jgi:hypothetical protein
LEMYYCWHIPFHISCMFDFPMTDPIQIIVYKDAWGVGLSITV